MRRAPTRRRAGRSGRVWAGDLLDRGRRTIDNAFRAGTLPDHAAEKATALIDAGHHESRSLAARWATAAGAPEYRSAFAKLLADPSRGHLLWDAQEADAYRAVAAVQSEMNFRNVMSTTDANGGYMIPLLSANATWQCHIARANVYRQFETANGCAQVPRAS